MPIEADLLGSFVALEGEASVYSVHDYVINLEGGARTTRRMPREQLPGEAESPDQVLLISLVSRTRDMTDLAIRVPELPQGLQRASRVSWGGSRDAGLTAPRVSTAVAEAWRGDLSESDAVTAFRRGAGRWSPDRLASVLRDALENEGSEASFRGVALGRNENPFVNRARSVLAASGSARGLPEEVGQLVGLGVGFTPSGDDFISGALLAATLLGDRVAEAGVEAVRQALHQTTAGGRTLLWLALRSRFPAYLLELTEALAEAAVDAHDELSRRAVRTAFRHGETSGMDAVAGLAWYLQRSVR